MWLCGLRFKSRKKHYEVAYQTVHQPYNSPAKNESEAKETDKLSGSLPRETYNSIASTTKENEQQPCNTPPVGSGGDNNVLQHVMSTPSNAPLQDEDKEEEIVLLAAAPSVSTRLKEGAKQVLGSSGVGDILVFDAARTVLYSNIPKLDEGELPAIASVFADRTKAIMKGIILQGKRYEVHRYHLPLVYGRSHEETETEQDSVGVALCKTSAAGGEMTVFALITYKMPALSARMIPLLQTFCTEVVEPLQQWWYIQ